MLQIKRHYMATFPYGVSLRERVKYHRTRLTATTAPETGVALSAYQNYTNRRTVAYCSSVGDKIEVELPLWSADQWSGSNPI